MGSSIRPSLDELIAGASPRPPLESLIAGADQTPAVPKESNSLQALHRAYKSGQLQKRNADLAQGEAVGPMQYLEAISQAPETFAVGVPGVGLGISAARAYLQNRPLADVQREVEAETSDVPYASAIGKGLGGLATAPVLPGGAIKSGAAFGAASGLLNNAQAPTDYLERAQSAVQQGIGGGVLGKGAEMAVAGGRTIAAKAPELVKKGLTALRSKIGSVEYPAALAEGQGKVASDELKAQLDHPDVAPIVDKLAGFRQNKDIGRYSPEMVDKVIKNLNDQQAAAQRALNSADPAELAKNNAPRELIEHIKSIKADLTRAASTPGTQFVPGQPAVTETVPAPPPRKIFEVTPQQVGATPKNLPPGETPAPWEPPLHGPASPLRTAAELRKIRALERQAATKADATDASKQLRGVIPSLERGTAESEVAARQARGEDLAANPYVPSLGEAMQSFRAMMGAGARQAEVGAAPLSGIPAKGPFLGKVVPAKGDVARRFAQAFEHYEAPGAPRPSGNVEFVPRQIGEIPTGGETTRVVSPEVPSQVNPTPALVPKLPAANQNFAKNSEAIRGLKEGYDTGRDVIRGRTPSFKNLDRKTISSLTDYLANADPEVAQQTIQGILGAARKTLKPGSINPLATAARFSNLGKLLQAAESAPATRVPLPKGQPQTWANQQFLNSAVGTPLKRNPAIDFVRNLLMGNMQD